MKKRVLFVDDEANVLQGLRRMLYTLRGEWDMDFAESGESALNLFETGEYDVVVTDMRMPGMDGAELLERVLERSPQVARIVLSGHAEQSSAVRAAGVAHQFLAKPCDADELRRTIARTCALRDRLSSRELLKRITGMGQLPSLPELYERLQSEMNSPEPSIARVGAIVGDDIGMSVKVLQLVNSAFFGLPREISDIGEATNLLGMEIIRDLVLSSSVFEVLNTDDCPLPMDSLWRQGIATGCVARAVARHLELETTAVGESAQAAMLLDAGRIALAAQLPDEYRQVVAAVESGADLIGAETEVFGCAHPEVGGYLLGLWGLSDQVVEAVTFHHEPQSALSIGKSALQAAFAAATLFDAYARGVADDEMVNRLEIVGLSQQARDLADIACSTLGNEGNAA